MKPKIYPSTEHKIDNNLIDSDALRILEKLRDAGYTAYLVGGSVRDLLVQRTPKDFDISTSALPEEVKRVFGRQCILIGRRFRLAHVRFGHKIIEVSTFRKGENTSGLILQDNEWGSPEEDVLRRDFTINGLFYDPFTSSVIDYVGGWKDIQKHTLRTIGDPLVRFKQDPVRMIRLLKFRARFSFEIDVESRKALLECKEEIVKSSPARVLEEIFRMIESGASAPFFMLMTESGLLQLLFPPLTYFILSANGQEIFKYLSVADKLNQNRLKHSLDRALLTCSLLFPILETEVHNQFISQGRTPHIGEIIILTSTVIKEVIHTSFTHFPRRISAAVNYILSTQYRLTPLSGKKHPRQKLIRIKEFEMALIFLKMRALVDQKYLDDYNFWRNLYRQQVHHGVRHVRHPPHHETAQPDKSAEPIV